jgi:hypothetical protein
MPPKGKVNVEKGMSAPPPPPKVGGRLSTTPNCQAGFVPGPREGGSAAVKETVVKQVAPTQASWMPGLLEGPAKVEFKRTTGVR